MESLASVGLTAEHLTAAAILSAAIYEKDVISFISKQDYDHKIAFVSATDEDSTQRFLIAQSVDGSSIYVCFRGTDNWKDVVADSKFQLANSKELHGSFHGGFYHRSQHFYPKLVAPYLDQKKKIIFCGHSMGGAVAAVTCMHMMAKQSTMEKKQLLYTIGFGSPMFADAKTKVAFESKVAEMNTQLPNHLLFFMHSSDVVPASLSLLQHVCSQFDVNTLKLKEHVKAFPIDLSYWESIKKFFSVNSSDLVGFIKFIFTELVGVSDDMFSCVATVWRVLEVVYKKAAAHLMKTLPSIQYTFIGRLFLVDQGTEFIQTERDLNDIQSTFESFFKNDQLTIESVHVESHRMRNYIFNLGPSLLKTEQRRIPTLFEDVLLPQHFVYDHEVNTYGSMKDKAICQLSVNKKHLSVTIDHVQCVVKRIDISDIHTNIKRASHSPVGNEVIFHLGDDINYNATYAIDVSGLFNTRTYEISLATLNELGGFRKKQLSGMDPITLMYYVFRNWKCDKMMLENGIVKCTEMKFRMETMEKQLKKLLTDSVFEKFKDLPESVTEDNSWLMWKGEKETTFNEYFTKLFNELFPALPWSILKKALVGVGVAGGVTVGVAAGALILPMFLFSAGNAVIEGGVFTLICGSALLGAGGGATGGLLISKVASLTAMNVKFLEHYIKYLNYIAQEMDLSLREGMSLAEMENLIMKHEVIKYQQNPSLKLLQVGCVKELRKMAMASGTRVAVMEVKKEDAVLFYSKMCKQEIFQKEGVGYLTNLQPTSTTLHLLQNGAFDIIYVPISYQDMKERSVDLSMVKEALSSADVLSIVFCIHNCNATSVQELAQMKERENVWSRLGYDHETLKNHFAKKIYYLFLNDDQPNYEQGVFDMDIAYGFILDLVAE